jgi:tRNA threonylcarbamoyladenosine biosynthesis protein TsaE
MAVRRVRLASEADTLALGERLARALSPGMTVYLSGDLGAGKTTLARGILRGLGYTGRVKSPSFAVVEPYKISSLYLYHFDFFRFTESDRSGDAGFRDYFGPEALYLVEWPENARSLVPPPDLRVRLLVSETGRDAEVQSVSEAGERCLARLGL